MHWFRIKETIKKEAINCSRKCIVFNRGMANKGSGENKTDTFSHDLSCETVSCVTFPLYVDCAGESVLGYNYQVI